MENNFYEYISRPLSKEEIEILIKRNNIIPEKMELYYDFCFSLYNLITETFLGDTDSKNETRVEMDENDISNHFNWCWNKTIENFSKEGITFNNDGDHKLYFRNFFLEIYYLQKNDKIKSAIDIFFEDIFGKEKSYTQSDMDIMLNLYNYLDRNLML
jgi:hypothetical protein